METARCRWELRLIRVFACSKTSSSPSAYSFPVKWSEIKTFQSGKLSLSERSHSRIPASPVLISCPPPTRQTTTAQSSRRFKDQIKNSGSDMGKSEMPFFPSEPVREACSGPCALSFIKNCNMFNFSVACIC